MKVNQLLAFVQRRREILIIIGGLVVLVLAGLGIRQYIVSSPTLNEEKAAEFFKAVYFDGDDSKARALVATSAQNNPALKATISVGVEEIAPLKGEELQIKTLQELHRGDLIVVYHSPSQRTSFLLVKDGKIRASNESRFDWDALNDELDQLYPQSETDWKEVTVK